MTMTRVERTSNKEDGMAGKAAGKKKTGNCSGEYGGCKGNAPKETVTGEGERERGREHGGRHGCGQAAACLAYISPI